MADTRELVRAFILENFLPGEDPKNLTDDTELKESGILDSLSTLKLVTFLEERFKIELEARYLDPTNLASVACIEKLVSAKMAGHCREQWPRRLTLPISWTSPRVGSPTRSP